MFVIFLINQTVQIIQLAHSVHPVFGEAVKYFLVGIYALLLMVLVYQFLRLPKPLKLPAGKDSKGYREFLLKIANRLKNNKNLPAYLKDMDIAGKKADADLPALEEMIKTAEKELDTQADHEIKATAQAIFVGTAVSQSGSLDGFVVLFGQLKMVWRIARIYNQRPALREMIKLYANVAVTSFAAKAIEDMDFAEIIEPVVKSFGSAGFLNFVPVISIVSNSIFSGAANALLTLRTGIITRKYCSLYSHFETREQYKDEKELKRFIKTSSLREAGKLLGSVIVTPTQTVLKMILNGLKKSKDFSGKKAEEMGKAAKDVVTRVIDFFKRKSDTPGGDAL
ncbi:MAG: DUF697 domain-containing protein [bacterium]|nr:DUF697 domain-containing protein [bacterium]